MIHLVLDDLRCPAGVGFDARLHLGGLILHLDCLISLTLTGASEKRQATFLGVVCAVLFDDLGIEHHSVCRSSSALVEKSDNALTNTYHISCHTNTAFSVRDKSIEQVLCNLQIFFCCDLRRPCKEYRIMHKFFYHITSPDRIKLLIPRQIRQFPHHTYQYSF